MSDYSQPDFYRFNEDSIHLVNVAARFIVENDLNCFRILDIGCGCGVVGVELSLRVPKVNEVILLEKNQKFKIFIEKNLELFSVMNSKIIIDELYNCNDLIQEKVDIIISNPPYYLESEGRISPNLDRRKCRHWSAEEKVSFFKSIELFLKKNTLAFISFPDDEEALNNFFKKQGIEIKLIKLDDREIKYYLLTNLNVNTNKFLF